MAFSASRIVVIGLFCLFFFVGIGLIYTSASKQTTYLISTPAVVCQIHYHNIFSPSQISIENCPVYYNDWVNLQIKSNLNFTLSLWLSSNSTHEVQLMYNGTNTNSIAADFPVFGAGSFIARLDNFQAEPNSVTGNLTIFTMTQVITPSPVTAYPYRIYGAVASLISVVALFLLIWNPGQVLTRKKEVHAAASVTQNQAHAPKAEEAG